MAGIPEVALNSLFRPWIVYTYDPAAHGRRFVVRYLLESTSAHPMTLVQNPIASRRE